MKKIEPQSALLLAFMLVFNGLLCFFIFHSLPSTEWRYIYPLDDTYIHLAIARNFAEFGNWGVVKDVFCSTSSAPAYTFMLGLLMKLFGVSEIYPLILSIIAGNLIILVLYFYFEDSPVALAFSFIFLIVPVQLPYIVLTGMEHSSHILLSLLFIILFARILKLYDVKDVSGKGSLLASKWALQKNITAFLLIALCLCMFRFEGMFLIAAATFFLLIHKRITLAVATVVAGLAPVLCFGFFSLSRGGMFFPNSLMLKGKTGFSDPDFIHKHLVLIFRHLVEERTFLIPIIFILIILIWRLMADKGNLKWRLWSSIRANSVVFAVLTVAVCHASFAGFYINFGRYEAYLYLLLLIVLISLTVSKARYVKIAWSNGKKQAIALGIVLIAMSPSLIHRLEYSTKVMYLANRNIFDQQYQMGRFLHDFCDDCSVVANDIGAITYLSHIDLLDVAGLGSTEVARMRNSGQQLLMPDASGVPPIMQPEFARYRFIMIYDEWYKLQTEEERNRLGWMRVATLHTPDNLTCACDSVSFYVSDPALLPVYRDKLREFSKGLPERVKLTVF